MKLTVSGSIHFWELAPEDLTINVSLAMTGNIVHYITTMCTKYLKYIMTPSIKCMMSTLEWLKGRVWLQCVDEVQQKYSWRCADWEW